jgi:hypothetical protein
MGIVTDLLNGISSALSAAPLKEKNAFLETRIAEAKAEAEKLETENAYLRERLAQWEAEIADSQVGERCPKCRVPQLFLDREEPDPTFGDLGVVREHLKCASCGHATYRQRK